MNHVGTFIVSQAQDMTHAISNDVRGWDDLANNVGAGFCAGIGVLECIHDQINALQYVHILENMILPSVQVWNPEGNLVF